MKERRRPFGRRSEYARMACKPDFVTGLPPPMTIPLGGLLPARSSCQPGLPGQDSPGVTPREVPIRHCSRWGLPCRPCCQGRGGLLPHRFTLTHHAAGGLFSVALSLGLPPPGVTRHRCLVESGLSSRQRRASPSSNPRSSGHPRRADLGVGLAAVNGRCHTQSGPAKVARPEIIRQVGRKGLSCSRPGFR
jgi:hypothetical protein